MGKTMFAPKMSPHTTDIVSLKRSINDSCHHWGFDKFAFFSFQPGFSPVALYSDGFPLEEYLEQRYFISDPILYHAEHALMPFTWDTDHWPEKLNKHQQTIFNALRDIGVQRGVAVAVRGPFRKFYVLCMSLNQSETVLNKLHSEHYRDFYLLGMETSASLEKLKINNTGERPHLSQRELECLYWVSEGKTAWETAQILSISERTVNFHLSNSMIKLATHSKHQAALKAISLGLMPF